MRIVLVRHDLREQNALLRRIAEALERMMPPLPAHEPPPYMADLSDLRVVDQQELQLLEEIKKEWARERNVVPDSEAFQKAVEEFETEMRVGGSSQEEIDHLPWNRVGKRT